MNTLVTAVLLVCLAPAPDGANWKSDPAWHDGLAEKATYAASRAVYGQPREYEAIFFTNKEQHDLRTLTKSQASADTVEVWKHNQIETIPTPNYPYHYVTTSHLTVESLELTRLDCSSQEFCGTSFKQYLREAGGGLHYWSFSYMPEEGRQEARITRGEWRIVPEDALPLILRDFPFESNVEIWLSVLPSQKSNRATPAAPFSARVRYAGNDKNGHKLELLTGDKLVGTYWMARDRMHVMLRYKSADGSQTYELKRVERVNYWTIPKQ